MVATPEADYPYRCTVGREDFARGLARFVLESLDYSNLKATVARRQGFLREGVYHKVWEALGELKAIAAAEAGAASGTICHLGGIGGGLGKTLNWDPGREQSDDAEANKWLAREQRKPWTYDAV